MPVYLENLIDCCIEPDFGAQCVSSFFTIDLDAEDIGRLRKRRKAQ